MQAYVVGRFMGLRIEVTTDELPPEARALIDGAVPIPEDVEYIKASTHYGAGAILWWFVCFVLVGIGLLFAFSIPQGLKTGLAVDWLGPAITGLLACWGALACGKAACRAKERCVAINEGSLREGIFIAPDFILWNKGEKKTCLQRVHIGTVHVQTVLPGLRRHGAGPIHRPLVGYIGSGAGIEGWLELPNLCGLSNRDVVARVAQWAHLDGKLVRGKRVGEWKWESPSRIDD
jgi:hypothetical protein